MKRPSFQFYPADWRQNANLRRCSPAARGVWMDVMCLLHDSEEYGLLRWPLKDIASASGATMALLKELTTKGVLKGDDKAIAAPYTYTPRSGRKDGPAVTLVDTQAGPVWYSSRMVKDEYIRTIRGESSRFGADKGDEEYAPKATPKTTPKPAPKPPFGDGSSSSSSSSSSNKHTEAVDQPPDGTGVPVCVSVCKAMQESGIGDANAADTTLAVLVGKGAEVGAFVAAAKVAVGAGKGFAYALGIVKNQMTAAAALADAPMAVPVVRAGKPDVSRVTVAASPHADAALRHLAADAAIPRSGPPPELRARLAQRKGSALAGSGLAA